MTKLDNLSWIWWQHDYWKRTKRSNRDGDFHHPNFQRTRINSKIWKGNRTMGELEKWKEENCECGITQDGKWSDELFDLFGCCCDEYEDCLSRMRDQSRRD